MAVLPKSRNIQRLRRGQSLVEFAVVALATYMLLAAIITFGLYFYAAQGSQAAVDLAARELSRTPLPANSVQLETVLYGDYTDPALMLSADDKQAIRRFRELVYDEHYLVIKLPTTPITPGSYADQNRWRSLVERLPLVNQQLVPLMIPDTLDGTPVLRFPGAVYRDGNSGDDPDDSMPETSRFLVRVPLVVSRDANGVETIDWVPVVEPIIRESEDRIDPFKITSPERGIVGLRLNYPSQSATMSSFRHDPTADDYPFEPTIGRPNRADDDNVAVVPNPTAPPPPGTIVERPLVSGDPPMYAGTYGGTFGLGAQGALSKSGQPVRPFRRVISAQAIYRREIFQ